MRIMKLAAAAAVLSLSSAAAAQTPARTPPPTALMPAAIVGAGLNVIDLEAQKTWYTTMLGMKVVASYPAGGGAPYEYVLTPKAESAGGAVLALLKSARPPGANSIGRLILATPDPKALAAHLYSQGVQVREAVPNVAYFITDPEGNAIELYRPPQAAGR
jgi:catechol-2,3-dioxygenase